MINHSVADAVKLYRTACQLTLEEMGSLCGVTRQAVHHWEVGNSAPGIAAIQGWIASDDAGLATLGRTIARIQYPMLVSIKED